MNTCFYCENGEKLRSLMIEICELPYSKVYLNRDQKHRGRCIVALKAHKTEYFQLTPEEKAAVSHRGKALAVFDGKLRTYLEGAGK